MAGMQTPSNGVAGHIRKGSDLFQDSVMVKTGTLNEPLPVRAVAGYFRGRSGRWGHVRCHGPRTHGCIVPELVERDAGRCQ